MALPGSAKYMIICMNGNNRRSSFHLESQINPLPSNKGENIYCATRCGEFFENSHILQCTILNQVEEINIEDLINGDINTMKTALLKWNINIKKIEEISTLDPV